MSINSVKLDIVDRQFPSPTHIDSVDYLPFGVKVLKLRVRRNITEALPRIWIRPKNYSRPQEINKPQAYGTADDDPNLWVAWGAGDECGFAVKTSDVGGNKGAAPLDDDDDYFIYLHLIHRPTNPEVHQLTEKTLTLWAVSADPQCTAYEQENGAVKLYGQLVVKLTVPEAASNPVRALWAWNQDMKGSIIRFGGQDGSDIVLPRYVSRWWPQQHVLYEEADKAFVEQFSINFDRQPGKLTVRHGAKVLAALDGDIMSPLHDYRLGGFDLFRFPDGYHYVLRLWLYWLQIGFNVDELVTFVPSDLRPQWRPVQQAVIDNLAIADPPWREREEVPDIERIDLLLDPNDFDVKYVCSDAHWREFWAKVDKGQALKANILQGKLNALRALQAKMVVDSSSQDPIYDPLANGLCDYIRIGDRQFPKCEFRPKGDLFEQNRKQGLDDAVLAALGGLLGNQPVPVNEAELASCERCQSRFQGEAPDRAVGSLWHKHAPVLKNAKIMRESVSSDVLEG